MKQTIEYSIAAIILGALIIAAVVAGQGYIDGQTTMGIAYTALKLGVCLCMSGILIICFLKFSIKHQLIGE